MQDEIRDKSIALVIDTGKKGARLTASMLKWAIRKYLAEVNDPKSHHGKQTVKQLVGQGDGVQSVEITDKGIKSFERIARKYGVDFAIKRVDGKHLAFFKARDADALHAALTEFAGKTVRRGKQKSSVLDRLAHYKEVVKQRDHDPEKHRQKGELEH